MSPPAGVSIRDRKMEPSVSERPLGERQTKKNECVLFAPADKTLTPIPPSSPRSGSLGQALSRWRGRGRASLCEVGEGSFIRHLSSLRFASATASGFATTGGVPPAAGLNPSPADLSRSVFNRSPP